jgi:hypothetical protein
MQRIFVLTRVLSIVWLIGFVVTGAYLAIYPAGLVGVPIVEGSALWHSLSIAYMATVTVLVLFPAVDPVKHWGYLLPLAVAKLSSSSMLIYWYMIFHNRALLVSAYIDGSIGVIAMILFLYIRFRS